MVAIVNARDVAIQAATRATTATGYNAVTLVLSSYASLISANSSGGGYTLPTGITAKLYLAGTQITSSVTFTPSTTVTQSGLSLVVNNTSGTGTLVLSGASWTSNSEVFTITATYNGVTYTANYTIAKALAGATGGTGNTGQSNHRVYIAATIGSPPATPGTTTSGATPAGWSATPVTLTAGQVQYQSDGTTPSGSTTTTWATPYESYLKVGSLEALGVATGALSVSGILTMGTTGKIISSGGAYASSGIFLGYDTSGTAGYKFSIGNKLIYDGTTLTVPAITISSDGILSGGGGGQVTRQPVVDLGTGTTIFGQRERNDTPNEYPTGLSLQFKWMSALGLTSTGSGWVTLETNKGYSDNSGVQVTQYAYANNGATWKRYANSLDTSWPNAWVQDLDRNNYTGDLNASAGTVLLAHGAAMSIGGSTATKVATGNAWDGGFYSKDSFTGGAYVSWVPTRSDNSKMVGLSTDPTANSSYTAITYAMFMTGGAALHAYRNGNGVSSMGSYAAGDVLAVTFDGSTVRWIKNGTVLYSESVTEGSPLFADSSFVEAGAQVTNIQFGPMSSNNWTYIGGAGKPQDNATVGAQAGVNLKGSTGSVLGDNAILNSVLALQSNGEFTSAGTVQGRLAGRNLIDTSTWAVGSLPTGWGDGAAVGYATTSVELQTLPDGSTGPVVVGRGLNHTIESSGGGFTTNRTDYALLTIDSTKTYRVISFFKVLQNTANTYIYMGPVPYGSTVVRALAGDTGDGGTLGAVVTNPYNFATHRTNLVANRWYMAVGYIHPTGYTGAKSSATGLYDCTNGQKITSGIGSVDYRWNGVNGAVAGVRSFQYFVAGSNHLGDEVHIWQPRYDLADGSEPSLDQLLAGGKLKKANDTIMGPIGFSTTTGIWAGTKDANDVVTDGVYLGSTGLVGKKAGATTFYINATTGDATFSGTLSAATGTFGSITAATGGSISSGQTGYDTGSGWWLGSVGSTPKLSIGSANGNKLTYDSGTGVLSLVVSSSNITTTGVASNINASKLGTTVGGATASASVQYTTDGLVQGKANAGSYTTQRNWYNPTTGSAGSIYYIKISRISGVVPTLTGATTALDTWALLTANQAVGISNTNTPYSEVTCTLSVDLSTSNTGTPLVASGTITLTAIKDV